MNGKEIIEKLHELDINGWEFADEIDDHEVFGKSELVEEEGGYEGAGEYVSRVRHFIDHNVYIRIEGFYSSYNGTDWDGHEYEEVKPAQKTITVYE